MGHFMRAFCLARVLMETHAVTFLMASTTPLAESMAQRGGPLHQTT